MEEFNNELKDFLGKGTTAYTCIKEMREKLLEAGYKELRENDNWNLESDKYFVIRNDASIIAFNIPKNKKKQFNIVCTHADTPCFCIKPNADYFTNGYSKLNVAPYGGILNYGFMDRPLSIAGRVILKTNKGFKKKIIDLKKNVAIIPSIAIHQNDTANSKLDLNTEIDLMPVIGLSEDLTLKKILEKELNLKEEIFDYDLYLYNNDPTSFINDDFIASPRIDNLTCTYAALKSFINNFSEAINVLVVFNSEEIGSNTFEGADSNFLIDTLKRICADLELDLAPMLANSLIISADNTHARHPNHDELSDHTNTPKLNGGILIMKEISGTTNGITSAIFKNICEKNNLKYAYYTSRNDFATGSTQAGLSLKHLSINSLDVGLPMLAMHSGNELIGSNDTYLLYQAFLHFYQVKLENFDNNIIIK